MVSNSTPFYPTVDDIYNTFWEYGYNAEDVWAIDISLTGNLVDYI
jgi:hypothetical protein